LLAASARRWAGALLGCSAFLVVVLGILVAHQTRADRVDRAIDAPVITWFGGHQDLAARLAAPGSLVPSAVLSVAIVIGCLLAARLNGAVLALLAVPVSVGLDELLFKPLFDRTYWGNLVYPSGHATAVFAVAATVTVLLMPQQRGGARMLRIAVPTALGLLGCIVAAAVIGLRWHYFTDTVAGAAVGIGTVCGLALLLDLPVVRSWLTRASRPIPAAEER
jgi:membrane-associated phospholipid phosphatase